MIFGKGGAPGFMPVDCRPQVDAGQVGVGSGEAGASAGNQRREQVDVRGVLLHHAALGHARPGNQQRHADCAFVEVLFAEYALRAKEFAVITGVGDTSAVKQAEFLRCFKNRADLFIKMGDQCKVAGGDPAQRGLIGHYVHAVHIAQKLHRRMFRALARPERRR